MGLPWLRPEEDVNVPTTMPRRRRVCSLHLRPNVPFGEVESLSLRRRYPRSPPRRGDDNPTAASATPTDCVLPLPGPGGSRSDPCGRVRSRGTGAGGSARRGARWRGLARIR